MGRKYDPDEVEMMADLEAMATAAEMEEGGDLDEEDFDWPEEGDHSEPPTYVSPLGGAKILGILAVIFLIIAVSVLYVYQAGDSKTILGNQPITTAQGSPVGQAVVPAAAVNVPARLPLNGGGSELAAQCPQCGTIGLPMCSKCNTVMQPIDQRSGLYVCPKCGTVGLPICPSCGGHMVPAIRGGNPATGQPMNNAAQVWR